MFGLAVLKQAFPEAKILALPAGEGEKGMDGPPANGSGSLPTETTFRAPIPWRWKN